MVLGRFGSFVTLVRMKNKYNITNDHNKVFWKNVKPFFSDKSVNSSKITLAEKNPIAVDENKQKYRPEVFLGKRVLKICSKFTGEHPCRSLISIKLRSNFIKMTLRHGRFPVNCCRF